MKKLTACLLALLMLLPLLLSCSESAENRQNEPEPQKTDAAAATPSPDSEAESETEPEETLLSDGLPDTDFGGYTFRVASGTGLDSTSGIASAQFMMMTDDYSGVPVKDALRDSTLYIENRFNVNLTYMDYGNGGGAYPASIKAGDDAFDILIAPDWVVYTMGPQGFLLDMKTVEQFDFSKPWWPPIMTDTLTVCGSLYAASSYLTYIGLHWTRALMVNKDVASELNVGVPYDTVRDGGWTLDALMSYVEGASADLNGNGRIDGSDRIGYTTGNGTSYCLQESVGISPYAHDEEAGLILNFDVDRTDTFISKMRTFMSSADYLDAGDGFGAGLFRQGKTLLVLGQIGDAYDIYSGCDFTYGFLPCPKFDELQESYINCCTDEPWAIPTTVAGEQIGIVGTIVEAMSCYNYQHVLPVYFDVSMKRRMADSPDDAEMLQLIADTRTTSFAYAFDLTFKNILADVGDVSGVSSYLAKSQKIAERQIANMVKSIQKNQKG